MRRTATIKSRASCPVVLVALAFQSFDAPCMTPCDTESNVCRRVCRVGAHGPRPGERRRVRCVSPDRDARGRREPAPTCGVAGGRRCAHRGGGSTRPAVISSARAFTFVYGGPSYALATTSISTLYLQDLLQTCTIVSAGWGICSRHASAHVAVRRRPARTKSTYHVTGPISLSHLRSSSCTQMGKGACRRRAQGRARAPCTR